MAISSLLIVLALVEASLCSPHSGEEEKGRGERDGTNESHAWMHNNQNSQFNVANWMQGGSREPFPAYRPQGGWGLPYPYDIPSQSFVTGNGAGRPQGGYPIGRPQWEPLQHGVSGQQGSWVQPLAGSVNQQGSPGVPTTRPQVSQSYQAHRPQGNLQQYYFDRPQGGLGPSYATGNPQGGSYARPQGTSSQPFPNNMQQGDQAYQDRPLVGSGQSYPTGIQQGSPQGLLLHPNPGRPQGTSSQPFLNNMQQGDQAYQDRPLGGSGQSHPTGTQQGSPQGLLLPSPGRPQGTSNQPSPPNTHQGTWNMPQGGSGQSSATSGNGSSGASSLLTPTHRPHGSWDPSPTSRPQSVTSPTPLPTMTNPQSAVDAATTPSPKADQATRPSLVDHRQQEGLPVIPYPPNMPQGVFSNAGQSYQPNLPQ